MKPEGHKYPKKMKADWNLLGQGKSTETVKKNMKGKWTIRWENTEYELDEYEDLSHDVWNITSKDKGDDIVEYKDFFEE